MNGNRFGTIFQLSTWGESHGPAIGALIDGCPSGLALNPEDFEEDMNRRAGGKASFTTPRKESDGVTIESGVFEGYTTGTPISLRILNENTRSQDYEEFRHKLRPGHADLTTHLKHGRRDHRGGGRSSARETAARVAAGVVAKKLLAQFGIRLIAWVDRVGPNELPSDAANKIDALEFTALKSLRDNSTLFVPIETNESTHLHGLVERLRSAGESWGGSIRCRIDGLPFGLGEPIFDKINALLAHAMMSLPACVAFEAGGGRHFSHLPGSAIRDPIEMRDGKPSPASNRHGGILGGMTTGHPLFMGISFHAPTSIPRPIKTVNLLEKTDCEITVGGRHDAFPLPRAVPMAEAMAALVIADLMLRAGRIPEKIS